MVNNNDVIRMWIKVIPYALLAAIIVFFIYTYPPNIKYDSLSYIEFDVIRPPLYPIFVWLFRWAGSYQFQLITWMHGIFLIGAFIYTRIWLKKNLLISEFAILLVFFLVLFTISFHFQLLYIQSEGLAFPLFIFTFFLMVECFQKFNIKKIFFLAVLVSILILTRLQFYYFYIVFGMLTVWYFLQGVHIPQLVLSIVILSSSIFITTMIDHGFHYIKHGKFEGEPYDGYIFLGQTLYLADNNASSYFKNPVEKSYVQSLIDQSNVAHLNQDNDLPAFKPSLYQYSYQSYSRNFNEIQRIIANTLNNNVNKFESNLIASNINKTLIFYNLKKNILFFLWKFVQCMGGVPLFLFFIILLIGSLYQTINNKIFQHASASIFVMLTTSITFLNAATIALCNPDLPPYFCYTHFLFYCLAALLVSMIFREHVA